MREDDPGAVRLLAEGGRTVGRGASGRDKQNLCLVPRWQNLAVPMTSNQGASGLWTADCGQWRPVAEVKGRCFVAHMQVRAPPAAAVPATPVTPVTPVVSNVGQSQSEPLRAVFCGSVALFALSV